MFRIQLNENSYLKMLDLQDAKAVFEATDSSRETLREWLPFVDSTQSVSDSEGFVRMTMQQFAANNGVQAGIWHEGRLAGVIGFHGINWANKSTSLGYWLNKDFVGLGLMTVAVEKMLEYAFSYYGLNRVEIRAATGNLRSQAIPERLGFEQEGVLREAEWLYDHYVDHVVYGLLKKDWESNK